MIDHLFDNIMYPLEFVKECNVNVYSIKQLLFCTFLLEARIPCPETSVDCFCQLQC